MIFEHILYNVWKGAVSKETAVSSPMQLADEANALSRYGEAFIGKIKAMFVAENLEAAPQ